MLTPSFLKPNDQVAVVAPARKICKEDIQPALEIIERWGLKPVLGKNVYSESHQFAGTDGQRLSDLQTALDDPDIKAILCVRGGYGVARIVDNLRLDRFPEYPKWVVGFSDITVLHCLLHRVGIKSLHAPMPICFTGKDREASTESLRQALFGENINYKISPSKFNIPGKARGQLIGGNLTLLHHMIGTPSDIDTKGKILFLEDLDEYLYHIDRMMVHLKRAGKLSGLAGLLVGSMNDMHDNTVPFGKTAYEIVWEHTQAYGYPVCFNFPAGHEAQNMALKFGEEVTLKVKKNEATLEYDI